MSIGKPEPAPALAGNNDGEMEYPTLHMHDIKGIDKIPDKGMAKVKFHVSHRSHSVDEGGKHTHSLEMKVHHIEPMDKSLDSTDLSTNLAKHRMQDLIDQEEAS